MQVNQYLRPLFLIFNCQTPGHRIQYSVFEIDNSERVLNNIMTDIENKFMKIFNQEDSVYIFNMSSSCKVTRYGYAKNEESTLKIIQ